MCLELLFITVFLWAAIWGVIDLFAQRLAEREEERRPRARRPVPPRLERPEPTPGVDDFSTAGDERSSTQRVSIPAHHRVRAETLRERGDDRAVRRRVRARARLLIRLL